MLFRELLAVDSDSTLEFFYNSFRDLGLAEGRNRDETVHVASILASYAQTSVEARDSMPPMRDLSEFFEVFILRADILGESGLLEDACAQSLFLNGFLRDQMERRHNVKWYDEIGRAFYARAQIQAETPRRRELFGGMAAHFDAWALSCRDLHRALSDNRYLLRFQ